MRSAYVLHLSLKIRRAAIEMSFQHLASDGIMSSSLVAVYRALRQHFVNTGSSIQICDTNRGHSEFFSSSCRKFSRTYGWDNSLREKEKVNILKYPGCALYSRLSATSVSSEINANSHFRAPLVQDT